MIPGEILVRRRLHRAQRRARDAATVTVANTGDRPDPGRLALPLLRDQRRAALRSRAALRHAPQHRGGHRRALRAGPDARRSNWWRSPARARVYGFQGKVMGRLASDAHLAPRLRGDVRPDVGRPRAARRHRALHRGRARLHRLRRGGEVRRRQGDPRRHGAEPARRRRGAPTPSSPTRSSSITGASSRPTSASRTAASPTIGKAGNPDIQPGVTIVIGAGTEVIAGEGMIVTAGGIDTHIHFICPQQIEEALMSRRHHDDRRRHRPGHRHHATTCTPGPWHIARMLQAAEAFPMNLGFLGKGNASLPEPLRRAGRRRRDRPEAARGLGHDARRDRQLPGGGRRDRRAGGDPHRHAQRDRASSRTRSRRSRAARSTPITPKARAAATRRTSSRSRRAQRAAVVDQSRRGPTPSTRSTSTSTC